MRNVVILGATGSIGASVLSVIRDHPEDFRVTGFAAGRPGPAFAALAAEFPDADAAVAEDADAFEEELRRSGWRGRYYHGADAAERLVRHADADDCVAAIAGTAGLRPAFAAAERGLRILLANKETLVSAGALFLDAVRAGRAALLPLDSEHAALWQCLDLGGGRRRTDVTRLTITASGGPFRTWTAERMACASPADALKHPVWRMGAKISVDSATLANKALEVIEAHHLFGLPFDAIDILVHPQSVVHGMAEFMDGSILAHMGVCDMRQPIACMLFHPERRGSGLPRVNLADIGRLDFEKPDCGRFPLLGLGLEAGRRGGERPAAFNAANETAVELFLAGKLAFGDMARVVGAATACAGDSPLRSVDDVLQAHERARRAVLNAAGAAGTELR